MKRFNSLFCAAGVVLTAAALAAEPSAAEAGTFHASGTQVVTFFKANQVAGTATGKAMPGGPFTSEWSGTFHANMFSGTETWTFGGGDTLTFFWAIMFEPNGDVISIYDFMGGTGRFEGASGSGDYIFSGDDFILDGTLFLN